MADQKITQLTNSNTLNDADLVVIVDDVGGTPVTEKRTIGELRRHFEKLDATPDADHTANGPQTDTLNAGTTVAIGELCYLASDGEWALADADATASTDKFLSIALEAGTDGNPLLVALSGSFVRDDTWNWTIGGAIYASTTAGGLTQTAPSATDDVVRVVGYAVTADVIWFSPETGVVHA